MKVILSAATALAVFAAPALASECPTLIQTAQDTMTSMTNMDEALKIKITAHIAQAQSEHDAGQHDEAVKTAKDALQLLKM